MHDIDRTYTEIEAEADTQELEQFEFESDAEFEEEAAMPLSEAEEMELAAELLAVSNEDELDQFLGKLIRRGLQGLRKVGSFVRRRVLPKLGGALKSIAKKALPVVGGALGSFIPIPGVGTAVGTALGNAVSKALELEFEGMDAEDQEFETARRIVRIATSATQQATAAAPSGDPSASVKAAVMSAARRHAPALDSVIAKMASGRARAPADVAGAPCPTCGQGMEASVGGSGRGGRWIRRGRKIVLLGV